MNSPKVILVTGGSRSGKTAHALGIAEPYTTRIYLATAEAIDSEMKDRIARHQAERGDRFQTLEEPVDLAGALQQIPEGTDVVLIDCMTVWLGNLVHKKGVQSEPYPEVREFIQALEKPPCDVVIVTNEVGSGIIPHEAMTRAYSDLAGWLNQDIANIANEVYLVVCGLPLTLKGPGK
ncbi:MAG: bifunctional adenosylcobinamide kinase/adenosylcobinamide-phosphate guanylyltransferase [Pontiella sp.]